MYIKVKVQANQKKEHITKLKEDTFEIAVKEKDERNQANGRVREIIARELSLPLQNIQIITGHKRSSKILFARNIKGNY